MATSSLLILLPDPTAVFTASAYYASPFFTQLLPIGLVLMGIAIGGLLVSFFMHGIYSAVHGSVHGHKDDRY